jgi:hypothetical protein
LGCRATGEKKKLRLQFYVWVKLDLLTLREEHRLRVYENRVLRRISETK